MPAKKTRGRVLKAACKKPGRKPKPGRDKVKAEVVRLYGTGEFGFREVAAKIGIPLWEAHNLWWEHYEEESDQLREDSERGRRMQTEKLTRIQNVLFNLATNPKIRVEKEDPEGGVIQLADFEKVTKASASFVKCSERIAKLNGYDKPVEVNVNEGTLSLEKFAELAEAHLAAKQ